MAFLWFVFLFAWFCFIFCFVVILLIGKVSSIWSQSKLISVLAIGVIIVRIQNLDSEKQFNMKAGYINLLIQ